MNADKIEFDEILSASMYMTEVDNHPKRDIHSQIDWQWVHTWWRKGAMWQFNQLKSKLEDKDAEICRLKDVVDFARNIKDLHLNAEYDAKSEIQSLKKQLESARKLIEDFSACMGHAYKWTGPDLNVIEGEANKWLEDNKLEKQPKKNFAARST